jgi:hypothetical protein
VHVALASAVLAAVLLAAYPPDRFPFYPGCPIHAWFGVLCPGCGATRALAALIRGNLQEALRENALAVLLLVPGVTFALHCYRRALRDAYFEWPRVPQWAVAGLVGAALGFTMVRNVL